MKENQANELNIEVASRTENSTRNTMVAMIAKMLTIVAGFCTRVIFTRVLNESYVGVNGLFTNLLNILNLSELGISTAIIYGLYKPIAEKDIEKQKSLMQVYKWFFRGFATILFAIGLLLIPFMDVLVKTKPEGENIVLIYLIYLLNCVMTYLFIYKKTLIDAYQLSYIGVIYQTVFLVVQNILQMIVLFTTKNFLLFVLLLLLCTILNNLAISYKADKMYPFLKDKEVAALSKEEKKEIAGNVSSMLMLKISNVVVNNTANLVLSAMVGIVSVGLYSNYYLIIGSVRQVLNQMFQGITASVGNLGVEESGDRVIKIFNMIFFVCHWLFGLATICLYELLTPFVEWSFGAKYVFELNITFVLCLAFFVTGMRQAVLVFKDSFGQFKYDRLKACIEISINIIASIVGGYYFGAVGIFAGSIISTIAISFWMEPYRLYKYNLKAPVHKYFVKYIVYTAVTGIGWYITDMVCNMWEGSAFSQCVVRLFVCVTVPNLIYLVCFFKSEEFRLLFGKMMGMLKGRSR